MASRSGMTSNRPSTIATAAVRAAAMVKYAGRTGQSSLTWMSMIRCCGIARTMTGVIPDVSRTNAQVESRDSFPPASADWMFSPSSYWIVHEGAMIGVFSLLME